MKQKGVNILLWTLLAAALFVRLYRLNALLGFWYDQGRDALVIWDFLHNGKLFLVGPTTGIEGIFRGPWYYFLIAPFYFLGKGDPLWPAVFLVITSVVALWFLYKVGEQVSGKWAGLLAVFIASFSYYLVGASRWLSNPTPMLLISMLLAFSLIGFVKKRNSWNLPLVSLMAALAIQFGSAAEIFYLPAVAIVIFWKKKNLPERKVILLSLAIFAASFIPQVIFDIRHQGVLLGAIKRFLFEEQSFKLSFWETLKVRIPFYFDMLSSKFWINGRNIFAPFAALGLLSLVVNRKKLWKNESFRIIGLLFVIPFAGMLFFQGNYGNVFEYYFTGYYLIFILFFSILFIQITKTRLGKLILALFIIVFLKMNYLPVKGSLGASVLAPTAISFANQKMAIDWVYQDSNGESFNVDVYVPPVIPYAYDYLFLWYGGTRYARVPETKQIKLLYTVYEVDIDHPQRLEAWLLRQKKIGVVNKEERFGGIIVQRRTRL